MSTVRVILIHSLSDTKYLIKIILSHTHTHTYNSILKQNDIAQTWKPKSAQWNLQALWTQFALIATGWCEHWDGEEDVSSTLLWL